MAKKSNVLPILLGGGLLAAIVFGASSAKASPVTTKPATPPPPPKPQGSVAPKPPVVIGTQPGNANVAQGTWNNTPPSDQSAGP